MKKLLCFVALALLLVAGTVYAQTVTISISGKSSGIGPNENVNVVLAAKGVPADTYGFEADIEYDNTAVEYVSFAASSSFSAGLPETKGTGKVTVAAGAFSAVSGDITLGTATFKTTAAFAASQQTTLKATRVNFGVSDIALTGVEVTLNVGPALVKVTISPKTASLAIGTTQQFTASGTDETGAAVGVTPTWSVIGDIGTVDATGLFTATTVGTGSVVATSGALADTAAVTVLPPSVLTKVTIAPKTASVAIGKTQQFTASGADQNGAAMSITPTWGVLGDIGTVDANGLFTAAKTGSGSVVASVGSLIDTAKVTVIQPAPTSLAIRLTAAAGGAVILAKQLAIKAGYDAAFGVNVVYPDGTQMAATNPSFKVVGDIGTITFNGLFTAGKKLGKGSIPIAAQGLRDTIKVVILAAPLNKINIKPSPVTIAAGQQVAFTTEGADEYGNSLGKVQAFWHTVGGVGTINRLTGIFKAGTKAGTGYVIAYAQTVFGDVQAGVTASAKIVIKAAPTAYALSQNYPNPFNPETSIDFTLPEASQVTLKIYNTNGQEISTLVDQSLPAGNHTVSWNGKDASGQLVSSGTYFYTLIAGKQSITKKMMLLR